MIHQKLEQQLAIITTTIGVEEAPHVPAVWSIGLLGVVQHRIQYLSHPPFKIDNVFRLYVIMTWNASGSDLFIITLSRVRFYHTFDYGFSRAKLFEQLDRLLCDYKIFILLHQLAY